MDTTHLIAILLFLFLSGCQQPYPCFDPEANISKMCNDKL